jgi:CRISPR system Cascade subunit CasA
MNPSFDLLQAPWVPCIRDDGTTVELGLRDALAQAHDLRGLHGESPLVTAALYRLLLAVLHRVFGPATGADWAALWAAGRWDATRLDTYLDRWRHRFDLFDPQRPFFQAPDDRVKPKSIVSLIHHVASGNNPTLFDHHTEDEGIVLTPAQAVRALVTAQAFGLAGLSGLPQKFTDGPCAGSIIFLVEGETLFETLALNLCRYPDETTLQYYPDDRPVWETENPLTPDRTHPRGYLDYLTWQNRRILLLPEGTREGIVVRKMTMAPALRLERSVLNPMAHYRRDEKHGPLPLTFREGRALWRDSAALFQLHDKGCRPVQAFQWLSELVDEGHLDVTQTRRYLALGMSKKQAKVNFYRAERMPLPLRYLTERSLVDALDTALGMAGLTARQLRGAARTLATFVLLPEADVESARQPAGKDIGDLMQQWAIERRYWSQLELPFRETVEALPRAMDEALIAWRKMLLRIVWRAFDQVADDLGHDARSLKAVVRARDRLAAGLARVLPA